MDIYEDEERVIITEEEQVDNLVEERSIDTLTEDSAIIAERTIVLRSLKFDTSDVVYSQNKAKFNGIFTYVDDRDVSRSNSGELNLNIIGDNNINVDSNEDGTGIVVKLDENFTETITEIEEKIPEKYLKTNTQVTETHRGVGYFGMKTTNQYNENQRTLFNQNDFFGKVLTEGSMVAGVIRENYVTYINIDNSIARTNESGHSIELSMDNTTYVVTANLKNKNGDILSTQTIDLPLEEMIVNGEYDNSNKKIVLTLKSGQTVEIPVADLVSGLQSEITSENKLSADLIEETTNKEFVSETEKSTWNGKSDFSGDYNDLTNKPTIPEGAQIYQTTGANIDGAMSQKASTDNFAKKYDSAYFVNGVGISQGQSNLSTKWQGVVDGITEPYDGMKVFYRINTWGSASSAGAVLSLDGGTHYYPIVYNVNSTISSRYSAGSIIVICFNSTQTARAYLTAGVATTVTGCWQIMDYGSYAYMRMYNLATTDDDRDLVMRYDASSISSGANSDKFGAITSNVILKANPKTGQLKAVKFTENGVDLEAKYALIGSSYTKTESDSRYLKSDGDVSVNNGLYVKTAIELGNEETPSHAYIDFHTDGSSTTDYNARLWVKTNENNMNFIGGNFYINGKQTATINDLDKYDDWCTGYDSSESSKGWYKFLTFNWSGNPYANRDLHIMVSSTYGGNYSGSLHLNIRWDTSSLATGGTCTWDWISGDRQFRADSVKLVRSDNKVDCYFYQPIDAGWHFTTFRVISDNIRGASGGVTWEKVSGDVAPITSLDNVWITSNMGGAERFVLDEEIQTNSQWIDGKPIYRLTKYVNLPDNESWTDLFYLHSSSTIAQIIKIEGVVNNWQRLISLPVGEGSYYRNLRWDVNTGYIQTINNGFQGDAYITVYFTKN